MFEQIITYDDFSKAEVQGVLSFRVEDIACFWKSKNDEWKQGLVYLSIKGAKHPWGDEKAFRVKYEDLKKILDK